MLFKFISRFTIIFMEGAENTTQPASASDNNSFRFDAYAHGSRKGMYVKIFAIAIVAIAVILVAYFIMAPHRHAGKTVVAAYNESYISNAQAQAELGGLYGSYSSFSTSNVDGFVANYIVPLDYPAGLISAIQGSNVTLVNYMSYKNQTFSGNYIFISADNLRTSGIFVARTFKTGNFEDAKSLYNSFLEFGSAGGNSEINFTEGKMVYSVFDSTATNPDAEFFTLYALNGSAVTVFSIARVGGAINESSAVSIAAEFTT